MCKLSISCYNKKGNWLHDKYGVLIMFLIIICSLLFFLREEFRQYVTLFLIVLFLAYDLNFRFSYKDEWVKYGRDTTATLEGLRAAIQYTSIFIGFAGVVLSSIVDKNLLIFLKNEIADGSTLLKIYTFLLLAIPTFMLLFIPVTYTMKQNHNKVVVKRTMIEPSFALKNYLFLILFLQKVFIILCIYFGFIITEAYLLQENETFFEFTKKVMY